VEIFYTQHTDHYTSSDLRASLSISQLFDE
jgi:hypothetical protein